MKVKDLKANKLNPRKISAEKLDNLKASLAKFGDLSGIVYNRRTNQLISGHQRSKYLKDATVHVEIKHEKPTAAMTVAEGHIIIEGERFKYREVDADKTWEMEALLAANKHGGEWDQEVLRLALAEVPQLDIKIAGFQLEELVAMDIDFKPVAFSLAGTNVSESDEEADAKYIKEHEGPSDVVYKENIDTINRHPTENPLSTPSEVRESKPDPKKAFDSIEEKTDIVGKRFIIIIDCKDGDHKGSVKDLIQKTVEEAGGKFF